MQQGSHNNGGSSKGDDRAVALQRASQPGEQAACVERQISRSKHQRGMDKHTPRPLPRPAPQQQQAAQASTHHHPGHYEQARQQDAGGEQQRDAAPGGQRDAVGAVQVGVPARRFTHNRGVSSRGDAGTSWLSCAGLVVHSVRRGLAQPCRSRQTH